MSSSEDRESSGRVAIGGDGRDLGGMLIGFANVDVGGVIEDEEMQDVGDEDMSLEESSSIMLRIVCWVTWRDISEEQKRARCRVICQRRGSQLRAGSAKLDV